MVALLSVRLTRSLFAIAALALLASCADTDEGLNPAEIDERYGDVTTTPVVEPYETTEQNYDFTGPTSIGDLKDLFEFPTISTANGPLVVPWFGLSPGDPRPNPDAACGTFDNEVAEVTELPVTIEGVVTLHPRFFKKVNFCGSDERYYGAYFIQDSTGGLLVLKDTRIADFDAGDRISLRVRGISQQFGSRDIMIWDEEQVISQDNAIYADPVDDIPTVDDVGNVVKVRGIVVEPPTNSNFNNVCLMPEGSTDTSVCDPRCLSSDQCFGYILAAFDREIGQRNPDPIEAGDLVELRGPVNDGFDGPTILIAEEGQYDIIE
jgi:hypothetical protein